MLRRSIALILAFGLLAFACGSDDSGGETSAEDPAAEEPEAEEPEAAPTDEATETPEETETPEPTEAAEEEATPEVTGPAPGVEDDSVKIGFGYVDTEALNSSIGAAYDFGEQEAAYVALIDAINAEGGIHGRQIEPIFEAVNPVNPIGPEEACVRLTQDEEVFIVSGFWLRDTVLCPVDLNETATVGGDQSPERIEQAKAPWIAWTPDTDLPKTVVTRFADEGLLDGDVAVFVTAGDRALLDDLVLPTLEELGIEPVATGVTSAPSDDVAAVRDEVLLIGESFEAAGADTVLILGLEGVLWPRYIQEIPYRPQLLFQEMSAGAALAEISETTPDIVNGVFGGGVYGPNQAQFEEQVMQDCIEVLAAAGVDTPPPSDTPIDEPNNNPFQAAFFACKDVALVRALLEAAGENLNYGTLELAIEEGFEVAIPGDPTPRTYGPSPASDGDPTAYLFVWDDATQAFAVADG